MYLSSPLETSAATTILSALASRRGSQVVRSRSAKPLFAGSIPAPASRSRSVCLTTGFSFHAPVRLIRCRPTAHPYGLRLCLSSPAGSIPAPASRSRSGFLANGAFASHAGSIDSRSPRELTLTGFVYVSPLPPAPFPPPPPDHARVFWPTGLLLHTPVRLIRALPASSPLRASSMSLRSRRLHSRPRLQITLGFFGQRGFCFTRRFD